MHTGMDAEHVRNEETKSRKNEGDDDDDDESGISSSYELDQFWVPPEPECCDDDMEDSVANYDDDECGDGWGKPTSLISLGEEGSGSYKFKEEKQKALEEVMNGKFKTLVNDLLKSFGVASSGDNNWVDIVTSLSWEAASFVKPDSAEGKAMDPNKYVKIKCIRTGSPSQRYITEKDMSYLILIFFSTFSLAIGLSKWETICFLEFDSCPLFVKLQLNARARLSSLLVGSFCHIFTNLYV